MCNQLSLIGRMDEGAPEEGRGDKRSHGHCSLSAQPQQQPCSSLRFSNPINELTFDWLSLFAIQSVDTSASDCNWLHIEPLAMACLRASRDRQEFKSEQAKGREFKIAAMRVFDRAKCDGMREYRGGQ